MLKIGIYDETRKVSRTILNMDFWELHPEFLIRSVITEKAQLEEVLQNRKVDLLMIYMENGVREKIEKLKIHCSDVQIIIISPDTSYEMVRFCFVCGIYDYLSYPLEIPAIEESIMRTGKNRKLYYVMTQLQSYLEQFTSHLYDGGGCEQEYIGRIFDRIEADWKGSLTERQKVVDGARTRIYEMILEHKKWIGKFLREEEYVMTGTELKNREENMIQWKRCFANVSRLIKKYQIIENRLVYRIGNYVLLHVDEKLSLDKVAEGVYLNASYISSIFKKTTGINFTDYVAEVKVDRAKILLYDTSRKIYDIAAALGYNNAEYFTKTFKKKTGIAPVEYQKQLALQG